MLDSNAPLSAFSVNEAAASANGAFTELWADLQSFAEGVMNLDPQEALIRAGLTGLVLLGAVLLLWLLHAGLRAIAGSGGGEDGRKSKFKLSGLTSWVARLLVFAGALLLVLQIWGFDLTADGALGGFLATAGRLLLTIVIMLAAIELAQLLIGRVLGRVADRARNPRRASQIRTLKPVISGVVTTALFIIAGMMVLSEIGIEIGPLLAGAGIIGLAVGFGAQSLVKDFLTGIFLIVEDIVSIGDIARIGGESGTVEDMSLRTIKLRSFDGTLHAIPYGEALIVSNLTKNFSYYVFELSIAYSADIAKALELMRETGAALQQDQEFASFIIDPIDVVGVDQLADSAVMLKARFKTLPGKQWAVGREYLKRIKLAFDDAGIEIPFPHIKLAPPDGPIPVSQG